MSRIKYIKQAGLSIATLEIYSRFSSRISNEFSLWNMSHGFKEHLTLNTFKLSLIGCLLHFSLEIVFIPSNIQFWSGHLSLSLKFEEDPISGCWYIPLLIFFFHWGSSSFPLLIFWGQLPFEVVFISSKI